MKRILFVDDEPKVLEGLRRMLHGQRREWDPAFVGGGDEALAALGGTRFDVIVTDMRMPGMDGAELLRQVREAHPAVVRIVLSGHTKLEAALRAVPVAHQFLSKPCDAGLLREVVERCCGLQALLGDPALRDLVGGVDSLPALPGVYTRLVSLLQDPEVPLREVAAVVGQDVGLVAKCLQLVNSAFFGLKRRFADVESAVAFLGVNMLKNLVLTLEVYGEVGARRVPGFSLERVRDHCLRVARLTARLGPEGRAPDDDAFLAGVLHDVGQVVLATKLPEPYGEVLAAQRAKDLPLHVAERERFGVTHAEVGGYLLGVWGLPYPVVEAVANHHAPWRVAVRGPDVLSTVHVADLLAGEVEGRRPPAGSDPEEARYLGSLGLLERLPGWRASARAEAGMAVA